MVYKLDNDVKTRQPAWAAICDAQQADRDSISAIFETVRALADDPAMRPLLQNFRPILEGVRASLLAPLPHHDRLTKEEQQGLHALTQKWNGLFECVGLAPVIAEPEAEKIVEMEAASSEETASAPALVRAQTLEPA